VLEDDYLQEREILEVVILAQGAGVLVKDDIENRVKPVANRPEDVLPGQHRLKRADTPLRR